jgi:hypothetical protein
MDPKSSLCQEVLMQQYGTVNRVITNSSIGPSITLVDGGPYVTILYMGYGEFVSHCNFCDFVVSYTVDPSEQYSIVNGDFYDFECPTVLGKTM